MRARQRYRLERRIGSGSIGIVWAAECVRRGEDAPDVPPQQVAIKFFELLARGSARPIDP